MTELELIIDLHKNSERQGPGSEEDTLTALNFLNLPAERQLKIADIGCGSGGQTLTLAKSINGQIIAVDLFSEFLNELNSKSRQLGLTDKIVALEKSMDDLPFKKNEFGII
jgi:ubiquinone/menaquinone biosynthesis C-methylase UbiE